MSTPEEITQFWFGPAPSFERSYLEERSELWFSGSEKNGVRIREKFEKLLQDFTEEKFKKWTENEKGHLALIILLDQFPIFLYPENHRSFAFEGTALSLAITGINAGVDKKLNELERLFFYMPLCHTEDIEMQERGVKCYEQLAESSTHAELKELIEKFVVWSHFQMKTIDDFGHFPQRNVILDRETTFPEKQFLKAEQSQKRRIFP